MSTDLDDLIRRDDDLYDLKGAREQAQALAGGRPQSLAGKLDALAAGIGSIAPAERPAQQIESRPEEPAAQVEQQPAVSAETGEIASDDEPAPDPREALIADIRGEIMSGDRRLTAILNGLGERRALLGDDDVKGLRDAEKVIIAQRQGAGA